MDLEERQNNKKFVVNANCIIEKYINQNDHLLFYYEKKWYHLDEVFFDLMKMLPKYLLTLVAYS